MSEYEKMLTYELLAGILTSIIENSYIMKIMSNVHTIYLINSKNDQGGQRAVASTSAKNRTRSTFVFAR